MVYRRKLTLCLTQVFWRRFRDPIQVPRIQNRVPRIREIGPLQVHTGYLTFSLRKNQAWPTKLHFWNRDRRLREAFLSSAFYLSSLCCKRLCTIQCRRRRAALVCASNLERVGPTTGAHGRSPAGQQRGPAEPDHRTPHNHNAEAQSSPCSCAKAMWGPEVSRGLNGLLMDVVLLRLAAFHFVLRW